MTEPNRENIRTWVDALRSGEYVQGHELLRTTNDRFCCLGVACEVAAKAGVIKGGEKSDGEWHYGPDDDWAVLPRRVADWLGIPDVSPTVREDDALTTLNDSGTPFAEIADLIEAEWLTDAPRGES